MSAATSLVRGQLERQLQAVVGMLDDADLDALLDLAIARFVSPAPVLPVGIAVHRVEARQVSRHGWVLGIVIRDSTPLATAWRWWTGSASGVALSEANAVARVAAKRDRSRDDYSRPRSTH